MEVKYCKTETNKAEPQDLKRDYNEEKSEK